MQPSTALRAGLVAAAVLGLVDVGAAVAGGGDTPPLPIAVAIGALGAATLAAAPSAWRGRRPAVAVVMGARVLSALVAVPGFFAGAPAAVIAAAIVAVTVVAVALLVRAWAVQR